jgi:hypothetical protein
LRALAGILSCQSIKPVKVVRKGFLTTPEQERTFSTVPIAVEKMNMFGAQKIFYWLVKG